MDIQLQFSLSASEYAHMMRYSINWRRYAWLLGLAGAFTLIQVYTNGPKALWYLVVMVAFVFFMYLTTIRSIRKGFDLSPQLQAPLHYHFTDADFRVVMEDFQHTYAWTDFYKAREVPDWFFLHQNEQVYNFIPKRAFPSAGDIDIFRTFLQKQGLIG